MKWFLENYLSIYIVVLVIAVIVLSLFVFPLESTGGTELYFTKDPQKMVETAGSFSFAAHNHDTTAHSYEYYVKLDSRIIANDLVRLEAGEKREFVIAISGGQEVEVFWGNLSISFWNE